MEVDSSGERMNKKIRNAQLQKTPYMLVVGDQEEAQGAVAVRTRDNEDRGAMPVGGVFDPGHRVNQYQVIGVMSGLLH